MATKNRDQPVTSRTFNLALAEALNLDPSKVRTITLIASATSPMPTVMVDYLLPSSEASNFVQLVKHTTLNLKPGEPVEKPPRKRAPRRRR
jgi:hypothetical protein